MRSGLEDGVIRVQTHDFDDPLQDVVGRGAATLDLRDVGVVDAGQGGNVILRQTLLRSRVPDRPTVDLRSPAARRCRGEIGEVAALGVGGDEAGHVGGGDASGGG